MTAVREGGLGRALTAAVRLLQVLLVALLGYAVVRANWGLGVNVGLSLVVALLPTYVDRRYGDPLHPALALLIVAAAAIHGVGMAGLYTAVSWYDLVAHAVSGAMIAGVGYAIVRTVDAQYDDVIVPPNLRVVFVVVFVTAVGVIWEIAEFGLGRAAAMYGGQPLLVQYGLQDVITDLVFSAVGGVLVALWGTEYFEGLRTVFADLFGTSDAGS